MFKTFKTLLFKEGFFMHYKRSLRLTVHARFTSVFNYLSM
jgi:hypothetical protein